MPQIEVSFDIDKNGIVNVTAKDLGTNKEQKITIESSSSLSDEEIDRMVQDAEKNAEADKKRREEIDLRNEADQMVFTVEKTLTDLGDNVDESEKAKAEEAKEELKKALEGTDIEDIRTKKDALQEIVQQLSVKMYEQAAQAQQGAEGAEGQSTSNDDDVVDAEYTEVNEDDKK